MKVIQSFVTQFGGVLQFGSGEGGRGSRVTLAFASPPLAKPGSQAIAGEQFDTDAAWPSDLAWYPATLSSTGNIIMSTQHRLPDKAADPWTLYCTKCSQKMSVALSTPGKDGGEIRTYACACGNRESIDVVRR